jgi:transposase
MQVVHMRCAGLDVHKKTVVVCVRLVQSDSTVTRHSRTFGTTTSELLNLVAWLLSLEVTQVAMESTGEFWKPLYNLLEGSFTVLVVNAAHIKHVPGRKTDVKDAEWIAELLAHGLMRPSFVPPPPQRALRDLTRQRTHLIQERASKVNRMQKVLEWANITLASVVTDITGVSARAMLLALIDGQTDVSALAQLAKGRLRSKLAELELALRGRLEPHHAFMISQHLALLDVSDEQIAAFDDRIHEAIDGTRPPLHSNNYGCSPLSCFEVRGNCSSCLRQARNARASAHSADIGALCSRSYTSVWMSSSEMNWAMRESSRTASMGFLVRLYPSVLLIG